MKKLVATVCIAFALVACKKTGSVTILDSAKDASDSIEANVDEASSIVMDTLPKMVKDSAQVVISKLEEKEKVLTEKVAKEIDSASKQVMVTEIKTTQSKIDSVRNDIKVAVEKAEKKTKEVAPKIIKETKIISKDTPQKVVFAPKEKISKNGSVEILVENLDEAKSETRHQIEKYDGKIKSEQFSSNEEQQYNYLSIVLPAEKSDFLIADLENYVGKIETQNIHITGDELTKTSVCHLEITLFTDNTEKAAMMAKHENFGGRMSLAISRGWNVIEEIFLFLLPFWPVFLIGGGIYFFFRKRNKQETEQHNM